MKPAKVTVRVRKTPVLDPEAEAEVRQDRFGQFAKHASHYLGSRWAFLIAICVVAVWAITGPLFHFSDTWQLVINTGTTIVTFLMVFLIQNTQNRDARAIHLKLNELIYAMANARDRMIDVEKLSDLELDELDQTYQKIRASAQRRHEEKIKETRNASTR